MFSLQFMRDHSALISAEMSAAGLEEFALDETPTTPQTPLSINQLPVIRVRRLTDLHEGRGLGKNSSPGLNQLILLLCFRVDETNTRSAYTV